MSRPGPPPVRVGISACLLGQTVRYDGGHKHDPIITGTLGRLFEWVPVCPEVELGLGVPRPALVLEGSTQAPRLVVRDGRADLTDAMNAWASRRLAELAGAGLCGYIFKSGSPSCGLHGMPPGAGLFARALIDRLPLLPVEDEDRLHDASLREAFVERVHSYWRSRQDPRSSEPRQSRRDRNGA